MTYLEKIREYEYELQLQEEELELEEPYETLADQIGE
tara:strand:- start:5349 stop:5459 length:111 start_codon:yes stop_codon:yes gene_type:complete